MSKKFTFVILCAIACQIFNFSVLMSQISNIESMVKQETVYVYTKDSIKLATNITLPVFNEPVIIDINIFGTEYPIEFISENTQYIIYDTVDINEDNFSLPCIYTRTPYNKETSDMDFIFTIMGYMYAIQDMRGRYESEGVYFPMMSDGWQKIPYTDITVPMDLTDINDLSNATRHSDGSESILYMANDLYRNFDTNLDGNLETFKYSNNKIGMFGASAMGNSQYQALSDIPHSLSDNPIKCLMPIVATNEHYNTTLFNNGVFRHSLTVGWISGQIFSGVYEDLIDIDTVLQDNIHSPASYGYTNNEDLANDLIDWFVATKFPESFSGAHPSSILRTTLDASFVPVDVDGFSDGNGEFSRYNNLNKPIYHITGWWDIFIDGQIQTFNNIRETNPASNQKLIIGPWAHQTIGEDKTGDVTYPDNVFDILGLDFDFDIEDIETESNLINNVYQSEIMNWYRTHLGGEPFFIIPESNNWQTAGIYQIRVPSVNYIIPYYQFLNYLGGQNSLENIPFEIVFGNDTISQNYDLEPLDPPLFIMTEPITPYDPEYFDNINDVRLYITGPNNDPYNIDVGNYWLETDSLPFFDGVSLEKFYLRQNQTISSSPPAQNEGDISYIADPNNPVMTIGGHNMIPNLPDASGKSQGSINLANPAFAELSLDRDDVVQFETAPLQDTMTVIGFPRAALYAKGKTDTYTTDKTDFDLVVRIIDVYPDGREMFISEGVVNARAREYAKSIFDSEVNEETIFSNIDNDAYYYFQFEMLPIGHTFGVNHKVKVLISSSNFPKYQSNPHIPIEDGEFFRWEPGDATTYYYNGTQLSAQNCEITLNFNHNFPSYIELPIVTDLPTEKHSLLSEDYGFYVYPNPSNQYFYIERGFDELSILEVYCLQGKKVYEKIFEHGRKTAKVNLKSYENGLYILKITSISGQSVSKKILKTD